MDCSNWLLYVTLHNCAMSIDMSTLINKFYSFIIFSLLINAVILLLNCLVAIPYLYIHFPSLRHHFLYLKIIWTFLQLTFLGKCPNLCTVSLLLYLMVLKTISRGCGVWASLMLFLFYYFIVAPPPPHLKIYSIATPFDSPIDHFWNNNMDALELNLPLIAGLNWMLRFNSSCPEKDVLCCHWLAGP